MYLELFVAATAYSIGSIVFGHFERHTPVVHRLLKLAFILGSTALISRFAGHPWALLWTTGWFVLGLSFHFWWTLKHHINPFTAEPRERYYQLRGWSLEGQ